MKPTRKLDLEPSDAAIVLKEDGTFETTLPEYDEDEDVPEHVLTSAALAYALTDEKMHNLIRDHFANVCKKLKSQYS